MAEKLGSHKVCWTPLADGKRNMGMLVSDTCI